MSTNVNSDNEGDENEFFSTRELLELQALEASLSSELGLELNQANPDSNSLSFPEIYSSVLLSGEIIISIPAELEEKVKQGLKNFKAKQAMRDKEKGLPPDPNILSFNTQKSDIEGAIDLSIALIPKNLVPILRIRIPDQSF